MGSKFPRTAAFPPSRGHSFKKELRVPNGVSVIARAEQLHSKANEQLSKAHQAGDAITRQAYTAAAKAYSEWALGIEQIALAIQRIDGTAQAMRQQHSGESAAADRPDDVEGAGS